MCDQEIRSVVWLTELFESVRVPSHLCFAITSDRWNN